MARAAQRSRGQLRAGDRFEVPEEGRYEVEDYLSYEEFEDISWRCHADFMVIFMDFVVISWCLLKRFRIS